MIVVRWSAAKGIGRVTGRLPSKDFADEVVVNVLMLFDESEGDGAWHGGCLALAELARRGLLLPSRLEDVVPLVVKALTYDVRRGTNSVGDHVRDAACYVCWAFARAYAPAVMKPHVLLLSQTMLITSIYDREVNCRRAASAAFQENVGRQGNENFPHGIEILTVADYFTLSNRKHAYTEVAKFVCTFDTYRKPLLDHLLHSKAQHWDIAIRELAAESFGILCSLDVDYILNTALVKLIPDTVSPTLIIRHGACLSIAEIIKSLGSMGVNVPSKLANQV